MKKQINVLAVCIIAVFSLVISFLVSCEPELETRDCVVMLGDSIFDYTDEETEFLEELSGHEYRHYYQNGAQMSGGSIIAPGDILDQYDDAISDGDIRTIIMDGGGNDYLLGDTYNIEEELREAWAELLDNAQADGVENIVVQGYYVTSTAPDGMMEMQEELGATLEASGAARGINLVYINPAKDSWFTSKNPLTYTIIDGIHPTTDASERLAQLVWDAMVANNIEQGDGCPEEDGGCY